MDDIFNAISGVCRRHDLCTTPYLYDIVMFNVHTTCIPANGINLGSDILVELLVSCLNHVSGDFDKSVVPRSCS